MEDIQMMKSQLEGIIAQGKALRLKETAFLEVQGINKEIEKTHLDKEQIIHQLEDAKTERDSLKKKKHEAVSKTASKIVAKLNEILTEGTAIFELSSDDGLFIGWNVDGKRKPYNGLSGAEKQIFDAALANVLEADLIIVEAAELDDDNLMSVLYEYANDGAGIGAEKQVIINTCHPPIDDVPEPFVQRKVS